MGYLTKEIYLSGSYHEKKGKVLQYLLLYIGYNLTRNIKFGYFSF